MDRSEDWCYFDPVKNTCLDEEAETSVESYSHWLLSISEIRNTLFIANKNLIQMANLVGIEDYFSDGPVKVIDLENEITFVLSDDLGKNLAVAMNKELRVFLLDDLLRGIKTFESFQFDSPIRLIQFHSKTLGVLLLSNELILISNNQITQKQSEILYFSFISHDSLIKSSDSKLTSVSLPSFSPSHETDSTGKTFGLASHDSKIFQFLVENETTLNLNIYSNDLQVLASIDLLDSFPFAAHSTIESLLELPVISKFWFCDQRNLVLMTASCLTSVEVIMMDEDMDRVNFEENTAGQFKLLWKGAFENTARGLEVIRVSDKFDEMFEYQLKDTSYNICQPPIIAARDSGGNFIIKRFIDLRKDYLEDKICLHPSSLKPNSSSNIEEVKAPAVQLPNPNISKPIEIAKDSIKPSALNKDLSNPTNPPNQAQPGPFETPKGKVIEASPQIPASSLNPNPNLKPPNLLSRPAQDSDPQSRGQASLLSNPFSSKPPTSEASTAGASSSNPFSSSSALNPFQSRSGATDAKPQAATGSNPFAALSLATNPGPASVQSSNLQQSRIAGSLDASVVKAGNISNVLNASNASNVSNVSNVLNTTNAINTSNVSNTSNTFSFNSQATDKTSNLLSSASNRNSNLLQNSNEPVTVSSSIITKMDEVMQLLIGNLQKSCKTIESLNVDYSKSAAFMQSIDRKCESIVEKTIRFTGKVRELQVKTSDLEDKKDFVKNNSDNYADFENEDIDERLFDDYTKLAESTAVYKKYFDIAVKPICAHHAWMRNKLDPNAARVAIDSIKKTKTFQPKNQKLQVDSGLVLNVVNESKGKLDRSMKDLMGNVRNSKRIFDKNPVTVYNFCLNSDEEED